VTHRELELQLDAYVDGELAPEDARELEAHLSACGDCARLHEARVALSAAIREQVPALHAPDALRQRVRATLRAAAGTTRVRRGLAAVATRWLALAASLATVAVGSWRLGASRADEDAIAGQVLASHVRSLMPGHLTDVVSSDQHTVKPWFNGRLDVAPPVIDLGPQGFVLVGGRLDYIDGRPVGAVIYRRRQHVINLFVAQGANTEPRAPTMDTVQGFNVRRWSDRGLDYWAVSDLAKEDLATFGEKIEAATRAAG
jgi:anti-sigma factor RsiW